MRLAYDRSPRRSGQLLDDAKIRLGASAGRLVTISSTRESSGAGLGHSEESDTTIAVTLLSE